MIKPLKVNLYLEDELPKKNLQTQLGGLLSKVKYLRADTQVEKFIDKSYVKETDVILWFKILNNLVDTNVPEYISRNQKNISFDIALIDNLSNVQIKNFVNKTIVLKLLDTDKPIDDFIEKWSNNKELFGDSIPDIHMCGGLYKDKVFICNYYITDSHFNYLALLKLDYVYVIDYIVRMMLFLVKCKENNIVFRNFKFSSLGYKFIKEKIEFYIGDYDNLTLIPITEKYFSDYSDGCDSMCAGTLVPYFIIKDFFEINRDWIKKLDKLYSVGLGETLIFLLYKQDVNMKALFKMIYEPSYLKPCLHYYHYMKLFDNLNNRTTFYKLISSLEPKYFQLDLEIINPMFVRIIQNCFNLHYHKVKYPQVYLQSIFSVFTKYLNVKNQISTFIEPIQTNVETQVKTQLPILNKESGIDKKYKLKERKITFNDKIDYF
jgi:hypothetical protein